MSEGQVVKKISKRSLNIQGGKAVKELIALTRMVITYDNQEESQEEEEEVAVAPPKKSEEKKRPTPSQEEEKEEVAPPPAKEEKQPKEKPEGWICEGNLCEGEPCPLTAEKQEITSQTRYEGTLRDLCKKCKKAVAKELTKRRKSDK